MYGWVERWVYSEHFMKIHCFRTFYNRSKTKVQCSPFMLWMFLFLFLCVYVWCLIKSYRVRMTDSEIKINKWKHGTPTTLTQWNSISTLNRHALHYIHSQHIKSVCFICIELIWCALSLRCQHNTLLTSFKIDFQHQISHYVHQIYIYLA